MFPHPSARCPTPTAARVPLALALAVVVILAQLVGTTPSAGAQSVMEGGQGSIMEGPQPAPFYHADPQVLAAAANGRVINSRVVAMPAFAGYRVTEIAYRSTDTRDRPILATATVVQPPNARPDGPVLSYQHYLNALGQSCAPTETLVNPTLETVQDNAMAFLRPWLDQGWTVIIPTISAPRSPTRGASCPRASCSTGCGRCAMTTASPPVTAGSAHSVTPAAGSRAPGRRSCTTSTRRT